MLVRHRRKLQSALLTAILRSWRCKLRYAKQLLCLCIILKDQCFLMKGCPGRKMGKGCKVLQLNLLSKDEQKRHLV